MACQVSSHTPSISTCHLHSFSWIFILGSLQTQQSTSVFLKEGSLNHGTPSHCGCALSYPFPHPHRSTGLESIRNMNSNKLPQVILTNTTLFKFLVKWQRKRTLVLPLPSLKTGSATLNLGKKKTRHSEMLCITKAVSPGSTHSFSRFCTFICKRRMIMVPSIGGCCENWENICIILGSGSQLGLEWFRPPGGRFWLSHVGFWGGVLLSRITNRDTTRHPISTGQPPTIKNYHPQMSTVDILKNPGTEPSTSCLASDPGWHQSSCARWGRLLSYLEFWFLHL